jgi:hypothetical protein
VRALLHNRIEGRAVTLPFGSRECDEAAANRIPATEPSYQVTPGMNADSYPGRDATVIFSEVCVHRSILCDSRLERIDMKRCCGRDRDSRGPGTAGERGLGR